MVLYYDERGNRRYHTLGLGSELTKGEADEKRQEFIRKVNGNSIRESGYRAPTVREFIESNYLPFCKGKWKESTAMTTENRIRRHLMCDLGLRPLDEISLKEVQDYLQAKTAAGLSFSMVDHLRWDLSAMFELAIAEKLVTVNPVAAVYTPPSSKKKEAAVMSVADVEKALGVLNLRERLILQLAVLAGARPGELLAVERRDVTANGTVIEIRQRVYRGQLASPKSGFTRKIAVPPATAKMLWDWMEMAVDPDPRAFVFAGETGQPLWRSSLLEDHFKAKLRPIGLGWVNFQVMRRTHASLGHQAKVDPKIAADQRGHGIGVALDVYTKSSMEDLAVAVEQLERAVLKPSEDDSKAD